MQWSSSERRGFSRALAALVLAAAAVALAGCGGGDGDPAAAAEFDRAFIDSMIPHHESALEMAQAAKDAGLREPDLVEVADAILDTQQEEIDLMRGWRAEWFGSGEIDPDGPAVLGLSEADMGMQHDADAFLGSTDVDADFAQMMITHHQGAIDMAELAEERAGHGELKELAEAIIGGQRREIERMRPHATGMHHGG